MGNRKEMVIMLVASVILLSLSVIGFSLYSSKHKAKKVKNSANTRNKAKQMITNMAKIPTNINRINNDNITPFLYGNSRKNENNRSR